MDKAMLMVFSDWRGPGWSYSAWICFDREKRSKQVAASWWEVGNWEEQRGQSVGSGGDSELFGVGCGGHGGAAQARRYPSRWLWKEDGGGIR